MKYSRKKLDNGLRIATISGLSTNAVTIALYIRSGFRFDPLNRPGLSHFTEHSVFNVAGTPRFGNLVEIVEMCGGWRNAFTWIEHQEHVIHLPKYNLEDGIKLLAGTIYDPAFSTTEIKKEKGVVKEEILANKSDPSKALWDYACLPLFFQGTHLSRPYSGLPEDIVNITESDLRDFASSYLQTDNTVMLIAGDLDIDYVENLVSKHTGKYETNYKKIATLKLNPKIEKRILVYKDPSYYKSSIMVGVETVNFTSREKYAINILRGILGGYFGATLIRKLRDKGGLIYSWETFHDNFFDTGYFVFHVSTAHENIYKVVGIIIDEFKRLSIGNFSKKEMEVARGHLIGSIIANIEKGQDYIEWYGMQELLNPENVLSIEEQIDIYKNITIEDLKRVASKYLDKENILVGVLGKGDESRLEKLIQQ